MLHHTLPFEKTNAFSPLILDYFSKDIAFDEFIDYLPSKNGLAEALEGWKFDDSKRSILVSSLHKQNISTSDKVKKNIDLLAQQNTYTVTTGHQLNLATGPLYFCLLYTSDAADD